MKIRSIDRQILVYGVLLAGSFAATYGYLAMRRGDLAVWNSDVPALAAATRAPAPGADRVGGIKPAAEAFSDQPPGVGAPVDYVAEERRHAADDIVAASKVINSTASTAERSAALNQLSAMSSRLESSNQPELLQALGSAATDAPEWQLRNRAVIALAGAAQRMTDRTQAIALLERAALDPHKSVAARARTALRNLQSSAYPGTGVDLAR